MTIEIRGIDRSELRDLRHLDAVLFAYAEEEEATDPLADLLEPERIVCAFDGGRMVGSSAALSLELTVPGGAQVRMAGITWVAVLMTHRRRGIMRQLMTEQLARMAGTGEPVAGLGASQSLLYGRFGFGPASRAAHVEMETLHSSFRHPLQDHGSVAHIELDEALEALPELHTRVRSRRNGMVSRTPAQHRRAYKDAAKEKDGAGPIRLVAHRDGGGEIDGIAAYRFRLSFDAGDVYDGDVNVVELLAASEEANAALWRFCLDHDLARRVTAA
jgi:predicted acetyltransferase